MNAYQSLSQTKWACKYPLAVIPKYRRTGVYGQLRRYCGEVVREVARPRERRSEEGQLQPDPVHMLRAIPPKYAVAQVVGEREGKSASPIARTDSGEERNCGGEHGWARDSFVSTGGRDEEEIRRYLTGARS